MPHMTVSQSKPYRPGKGENNHHFISFPYHLCLSLSFSLWSLLHKSGLETILAPKIFFCGFNVWTSFIICKDFTHSHFYIVFATLHTGQFLKGATQLSQQIYFTNTRWCKAIAIIVWVSR